MTNTGQPFFAKIDGDYMEYRRGAMLDIARASSGKLSKAVIQLDKLFLEITTRQEWDAIRDHLYWMEISRPDLDPAKRRKLLSDRDTCPCCHQWLGHNHPPADDSDPS